MSAGVEYVPRRHRITVDEYLRMAESGSIAPDARVELIDGVIIDMPPIGSAHAAMVRRLNAPLQRAVEGRATVSCQSPGSWTSRTAICRIVPRDNVNNLEEIHAMLLDRRAQWEIELKAEGRRDLLIHQLHARFGRELPRWVQRRVQRATSAQLKRWGTKVLKAASLHEIFGRTRRSEAGSARAGGDRISA